MKLFYTPIFLLFSCLLSAQNRFYVNVIATGTNSGQDWENAYTNLQTALHAVQAGDEIWMAAGTYLPTNDNNRDTSFQLKSGVHLYGGFAGTEVELAQRNWQVYPTILSGDIGLPGDSTDNSYTILYLDNPDSTTLVDGLIFRFGQAASADPSDQANSPRRSGGAIYIMGANGEAYPTIRHCRFEYNYALKFGGAVYINGLNNGSVAPIFLDCVFAHNTAGLDGGAVYRSGSSWIERTPDFGDCSFNYNFSNRWAGALYYEDVETSDIFQIWNSSFTGNETHGLGGGAYLSIGRESGSKIEVKNCDFKANYGTLGSALCVSNLASFSNTQYVKIINTRFIKNIVGETGGVVYLESTGLNNSSILQLDRDTFLQNTSSHSSTVISAQMFDHGTLNLTKCHISENNISLLLNLSCPGKLKIQNTSIIGNTSTFALLALTNNVAMDNVILSKNTISGNGYSILLAEINLKIKNSILESKKLFYQGYSPSVPGQSSINIENSVISGQDFITYKDNFVETITQISYSLLDSINLHCSSAPPGVTCGPGNLFGLDPMFRDTANGDYSLLPCSPLINAGSNIAAANISTDLAGGPRILGGTVDIGVYEAPNLALTNPAQIQPACAGASNGSISVSPAFGCEPYAYNWSPAAGNGPQLNGLPPGAYYLTLTDSHGRQLVDTLPVAIAALPVLASVASDVQCGSLLGGSISANASGGTPPWHYQWLPSAGDTAKLTLLAAGNYAVTVLDANGCQDSTTVTIARHGALVMQVAGEVISCHHAADGWFSAKPLTGAAPFQWWWQGWTGTDSIAQPLAPGTYAVTVADAFGCTAAFAFPPLTNPDSLSLLAQSSPQTNLLLPNGQALVTSTAGGTLPYQYAWSTNQSGLSIMDLTAGQYTVTVTDGHGCTTTSAVTVQLIVGTDELQNQAVLIYPNPTADWVTVVLPESAGERSVELIDASGQVVLQAAGNKVRTSATLHLGELPPGAYLLLVRSASNGSLVFTGKVTKQ